MEMHESIKDFNKQFAFEPEIVNGERLGMFRTFIVAGMGGSNLSAGLVKIWKPELDIVSHRDYGLPVLSEKARKETLVIASSYSGNTEEAIAAFEEAGRKGLPRAAISTGGKLLELAKEETIPYIKMPDTGIQPRMATGYSIKALLKFLGEEQASQEIGELVRSLLPVDYEERGKALAGRLRGYVPVIYSSLQNRPIAYNWKIKFNETAKIPAFYNVFPEANHNEMTGFDIKEPTAGLSRNFYVIILRDSGDYPKILKRMEIAAKLYCERGLTVETIELEGRDAFLKIFSSLVIADWAAYYTAEAYGNDPTEVPMVEEFKKLI